MRWGYLSNSNSSFNSFNRDESGGWVRRRGVIGGSDSVGDSVVSMRSHLSPKW